MNLNQQSLRLKYLLTTSTSLFKTSKIAVNSRDIYTITSRVKIKWNPNWIYIGTGDEIDKAALEIQLLSHFGTCQIVMLKRGRHNSLEIAFADALEYIANLTKSENLEIWSSDFKVAIRFDKIGVMNKSEHAFKSS